MTVNEAVRAAMDGWKAGGELNVDRMREKLQELLDDAVAEWQEDNVDAITDEEMGAYEQEWDPSEDDAEQYERSFEE